MRVHLLFFLAGAVGCGSSGGGGDDAGEPPGGSFDIAGSISATVTTTDGAGDDSSAARIVLASTADLCGDAGASPVIDRKGQRFITIELRDVNGAVKTAPTAPGTYTIYPNTGSEPAKSASLIAGGLDDTCQLDDDLSASGQSGTVTLTSVTGGVYAGSYDVVLNTGEKVAGSFAPTGCPALATASSDEHSCR
jgi:hypothetical protein